MTRSNEERARPYVTTTQGMRGYYAVLVVDDEPWNTSPASFTTKAEAEEDARNWAAAENVEFRP